MCEPSHRRAPCWRGGGDVATVARVTRKRGLCSPQGHHHKIDSLCFGHQRAPKHPCTCRPKCRQQYCSRQCINVIYTWLSPLQPRTTSKQGYKSKAAGSTIEIRACWGDQLSDPLPMSKSWGSIYVLRAPLLALAVKVLRAASALGSLEPAAGPSTWKVTWVHNRISCHVLFSSTKTKATGLRYFLEPGL